MPSGDQFGAVSQALPSVIASHELSGDLTPEKGDDVFMLQVTASGDAITLP